MNLDSLKQTYARHKRDSHEKNSSLWDLCLESYTTVGQYQKGATRTIAEVIGTSVDSLENWAKVGKLIEYTSGVSVQDEQEKTWTLKSIWATDALEYDHLLQTARWLKNEEPPEYYVEFLLNALQNKVTARDMGEEMERQLVEPDVLLRKNLKRWQKAMKAQLVLFQDASPRVRRIAKLFIDTIEKDLNS